MMPKAIDLYVGFVVVFPLLATNLNFTDPLYALWVAISMYQYHRAVKTNQRLINYIERNLK